MKNKRHFWSADTLLYILCGVCIVLAVMLAFASPTPLTLGIAGGAVLLVLLFALITLRRLRRTLRRLLSGGAVTRAANESGLTALSVPAAAFSSGNIVWCNASFRTQFAGGEDIPLMEAARLLPGFDEIKAAAPEGQDLALNGQRFTVFGSGVKSDEGLYLALFMEDTRRKLDAEEYHATRPAVLYFVVDTYDEILKEMKESDRARIMSGIDLALENYVAKGNGFLRRVSNSRYVAVVEERYLQRLMENRFDILDVVRKMDGDVSSLSIGVGRLGKTLKECDEKALQALDMALGRGGDQAAVNGPDGFEFYGGLSRSIEKRTKVKSRIIAGAIKELMGRCDQVLIMGHKNSDMDSVGAAVGMLRFARICQKPAHIVIDREGSLSDALLKLLEDGGYDDAMLDPDDAMELAGKNTLLVVVDTHLKYLLESKDVYEACGTVVVIDHHRRGVGHVDNAMVFYHEPYASSASELVSELLQYVGSTKDDKPTPMEAEALLAGIMLDTRTFSLNVGVRTFEASAYLRRMGAQTAVVKRLFASSMDEYMYRCHLVSEAKVKLGCAVVVSDKVPPACEVVAPQAANDLLTIEGVKASFVAIMQGGQVRISARSMGEVNVQLVLEKLGGGGHQTMAGAQLRDVTLPEAEKRMMRAIEEYWQENEGDTRPANG